MSRSPGLLGYPEAMREAVFTGGSGPDAGIGLASDGTPTRQLLPFDLDRWHNASRVEVEQAARAAADSLALTVGLSSQPPPDLLGPLLDALTLTLVRRTSESPDKRIVMVDEPERELERLVEVTRWSPQACVVAGQLLRQTSRLDSLAGLAAEAAAYSMLLSGSEFEAWLAGRGAPKPVAPRNTPPVHLIRDGGHLSIVLDRPERRNAFSVAMREALTDALAVVEADDTITDVDLCGAGKVFCSGGDLAEFGTASDFVAAYLVRLDRAPWRLIDRLADRVNIRIHGAAVGAGIELAAFAGRVTASPDTFFRLPEIEMGLVPGAGGTVSITRRIGRWRTAWMVLSGQPVDAETALGWGLIDQVTDS